MEATPAAAACSPTAGRRERKKQRTREALVDSAFRLFAEKGFEATTVEEIADAVDVSSRTFFRYFASKEDVLLTFQDEQFCAVREAFAARPADEPVITAIRHAAVSVIRGFEEGAFGFDPERFGCIRQLMESSPAVFGSSLEHGQKKHAEMTRLIAERMGVDPAADLRPHVVATVINSAFHTAFELLNSCTVKADRFSDVLSELLLELEGGINFPSATAAASST
jgi:AcrR family transcriptional regulator